MPMTLRIAAALSLCATMAVAETVDVAMDPGANYDKANFRLWLPDGFDVVRAVLVLVPGSNGDGRAQVEEPFWQEFATRFKNPSTDRDTDDETAAGAQIILVENWLEELKARLLVN